jgi:hypothetical protein
MKHSPESCPLGNSKNLDIMIKWLEDLDIFAAKYGIKVLGVWFDRAAHTAYAVFDSPSMDAFTNFEFDQHNIELITIKHIEKTVVTCAKDTLLFFKEYKTTTNQH